MATHDAEFESGTDTLEAIRDLRNEMRLEMNELAESVAHTPVVTRPPTLWGWLMPTILVVGGIAAGIVATIGYYEGYPQAESVDEALLTRAELNSALEPQTQRLEYLTSSVSKLSESTATKDNTNQQQSLKQLQTSVATLVQTVKEQGQQFEQEIERTRQELTAEVARVSEELRKPTTVGRAPLPNESATALEPTPDANASASAAESAAESRPVPDEPAAEQAVVRGKLLLLNPGTSDVELLVNNVPITVQAGGTTNVPVSVGVVKTQFASSPDNAAYWNQWDYSSGEPRLSIDVHFGAGFVELRPHS